MRHYFQFLISACMAFVIACTGATAEEYPNRPVRILVGTAAGSGPDVLARSIAAQLSVDLGQNFFVENRTGANATLASKMVAQSEADGYTLLFSTSSIAISPFLYQNLGYDPKKEITAVVTGGIVEGYLMLVNPDLPVKNVAEFIEYAKKIQSPTARLVSAIRFISPPKSSARRPASTCCTFRFVGRLKS